MPQPQGARLPAPRLHSPHAAKTMQSLVMFSDRLLELAKSLRDGFQPKTGGPGGFPNLEGAGKFDAINFAGGLAQKASHQQAPGDGSEFLDRLGDGGQIGPERQHPVEIVETDDRDVGGNIEAEPARGLDRGERANVGEGEYRRWPVGAVQLHLDRAAQALEVVAATNHALAALETRLAQRATAPRDALGDVLMVFGMSENGDIAVPQADQMDHGFIGASLAIGPHSVETRRVGAPVEQHGRRQPDLTLPDGDQRGVVRGYSDQAVNPPRDE